MKKYIWLKTKDYVKRMDSIFKILYWLGIIEQKRWKEPAKNYYAADREGGEHPYQIHSGGFYRAKFGFRWWNPLTYIAVIILIIIGLLRTLCISTVIFAGEVKEGIYDHMEVSDPRGLMTEENNDNSN